MKEQERTADARCRDEELIARVQAGEEELFDIVSARYRAKLHRYVLKYVHSDDIAEDVMQNVFIKAHKNIQTFDTTRMFSPWIYRIAHNEAINAITAKNNKKTVSLDAYSEQNGEHPVLADVAEVSMEKWFQEELREEMATAIAQLPDKYADIITMRFLEELSYQEISDKLHIPVNTVGTLVRRAKKRLLQIILAKDF